MKKLSLSVLFVIVSTITYSQLDFNSIPNKQIYIQLGSSKPLSGYYGYNSNELSSSKRSGGMLEFGAIYYFGYPEKIGYGLMIDFIELKYHHLSFPNGHPYLIDSIQEFIDYDLNYNKKVDDHIISLSSKIGPCFSVLLAKGLIADAHLKMNISWLSFLMSGDKDWDANDTKVYAGGLGIGYSTGINLKYKFLKFGIEYNSTQMKMYDSDYDDVFLGNYNDPKSDKTPFKDINIFIGACFNM